MGVAFHRIVLVRAIAMFGAVGGACLTRPVDTWPPEVKTTITNKIQSQAVDKLDLLFMIDNSESMGDKQALLAQAVPDMLRRLVTPNCIADDGSGRVLGPSDEDGRCMSGGKLEFPQVHDMHIGIVTSSLGGRGPLGMRGSWCDPTASNEANPNLPSHNDDRGELINRGGDTEAPVANAGSPLNFIAWFPTVRANRGKTAPPAPVVAQTRVGDPTKPVPGTLIGDFTTMIRGVHEHGCGFEAQNEAWYRFLVQPDPFDTSQIHVDADNRASVSGLDTVILKQRAAFLRPDSLLAIIVVTDENEEVANPLSVGRQGWMYEQGPFSTVSNTAPEGTIECKSQDPNHPTMTGPNDPNCTSCAFSGVQSGPNFAPRCPSDPPDGTGGFLGAIDDQTNVRFFHQKARFGVFAGYPVSRYIRGLTAPTVPDRAVGHEVDGNGNYIGDQDAYANCVNPIFAQNLPDGSDPNADLCHLVRGPRTPSLVYYAAIAGVPHQLLQARAGADPECSAPAVPAGTPQADCPQKNQLVDADWLAITGKDPEHYDFTGADFHMLESWEPRSQSPCTPTSGDNCDPINGREWEPNKGDLEFACIFPLVNPQSGAPQPKDCGQLQYRGACDCEPDSTGASNPQGRPLCEKVNGKYTGRQIYGKAYPSVREMEIAHAMGTQGIVSSLCPIHPTATGSTDPLYGYRPAVNAIVNHLKDALVVECLPHKLTVRGDQGVPCLVLLTLPNQGNEEECTKFPGLSVPPPGTLAHFKEERHNTWLQSPAGWQDPALLPVCEVRQLTPWSNDGGDFQGGTCVDSPEPGWCYLEGQAGGQCPQELLFTSGMPPSGAIAYLQCIE
jgi:hypothetical protein